MKTITYIFRPLLLLTLFMVFAGCQTKQDTPEEAKPTSPPPQVEMTITKIDDILVEPEKKPKVGLQVLVDGTISEPKVVLCVLVHPMTTDIWWVQNLPSPPGKIDDNTWRWRTRIYCGTEELGLNEDFEIVAIAESKRTICVAGKTLKTLNFPLDLPRTEILTVKRVRN